jgi:hypothetical protein
MPITAVIIVTAAVHIRIPTIRPAAVVDSHVSCSVRSGGSDRTQTGNKKHSEQYQLQQTVPGVKSLPRQIGTAYPTTRFAVAHLHILDKGPSHVQKQNIQDALDEPLSEKPWKSAEKAYLGLLNTPQSQPRAKAGIGI